ncbi:MAG: DNA polymerase III subunit gamma/tau [Pantoea sp. Brub]|nr:DNA polymerase III subunit gamma/tau [Pantoea sp. Brub]
MVYKVLARKWRPQKFCDVIGQEHVLKALINGLSLGRIHHAYLFSGTRGIGKTTIARLLAKSLNCMIKITPEPCNTCNSCIEFIKGNFIDLIEIDAASKTKVEDIRDILDNVQYAPTHSRFKIYLIDEVHMLSRHSFNALLKTLEEPPSHVKFLLATTEPNKLPVTILSRCLTFYLKVLTINQINQQIEFILKQENIISEPTAIKVLSNAADGSMRDALSITDQAIAIGNGEITLTNVNNMLGIMNDEYLLDLVETLLNGNFKKVMDLLHEAELHCADWEKILVGILYIFHRMMMIQVLPCSSESHKDNYTIRLIQLAQIISPDILQLYYQIVLMGRKDLLITPNQKMGIDITLLRLLAFKPNSNLNTTNKSHFFSE